MPLMFHEVVDGTLFPDELFADGQFRWRMGVRSVDRDEWLQPDDLREADLAEKAELLRTRFDEVFVALPGSEPAAAATMTLVEADLKRRGLAASSWTGHPLDRAGRSVQEDLCLVQRRSAGWTLTAGSVCFPTRWSLPDKIGATLTAIHDPVPGYGRQLASRVDRFFDRMAPEALASRLNWSLVASADRRIEVDERQAAALPQDPGRDLHLRLERQTLRRLASVDAIVFGIRVHAWPLGEVAADLPAAGLAGVLDSMDSGVAVYKNLEALRGSLRSWLVDGRR